MNNSTALLPTGKRYNPYTREGFYADPAQVAYIIKSPNHKGPRVATSFGSVGWPLGYRTEVHHDQTRRPLGNFRVIGIARPDGSVEGEVPDRKISHWVFK